MSGCQHRAKSTQTLKKVQMVLLPHSAFIGLEGFYIIESAEILHDYHNVPLKNASSMITATRNYIQCLSASCAICRHVTFSENFPIERMAKSQSLHMGHVLHKKPYDRRRKAYRLPQMIKRSFQHKLTAFFCGRSIRRRPKMSIALAAPKPKPPSNYNFVSKSLQWPHSSS